MLEYQQRVVQEKDALAIKLSALQKFILSTNFELVKPRQQVLLRKQSVAMQSYLEALEERVDDFDL